MPLPRMNLAGDACCEPCIEPCGTCDTGDCVDVAVMIHFREEHDYKCGWPALTSPGPTEPDSDPRRWRKLTMRFQNEYSLTISGPVGPCSPYVGDSYTASLDVTAEWHTGDPPYGGNVVCYPTAGLSVTGGYTFTDSEEGDGSITPSSSPDLPTYDGYGPGGFLDFDGPDLLYANNCPHPHAAVVSLVSTIGPPDDAFHQVWTGTDSDTGHDVYNPPDTHGHTCDVDCDSSLNEAEFTLSDEFPTADLVANVQDAIDAATPGGTGYFVAFSWLATDELYCSARWLEYSFNLTPPVGQDATVTWNVKEYSESAEGVANILLSTTPMSEVNPDGTTIYNLHPTIGGPNRVLKVEDILVTCTPV